MLDAATPCRSGPTATCSSAGRISRPARRFRLRVADGDVAARVESAMSIAAGSEPAGGDRPQARGRRRRARRRARAVRGGRRPAPGRARAARRGGGQGPDGAGGGGRRPPAHGSRWLRPRRGRPWISSTEARELTDRMLDRGPSGCAAEIAGPGRRGARLRARARRASGCAPRSCSRRTARSAASRPAIAGVAAAVETVHTYSLVHDDLPCMDDDDLRRGRPTTHRRFDVPTATRAGYLLVPVAARVLAAAAGGARAAARGPGPDGDGAVPRPAGSRAWWAGSGSTSRPRAGRSRWPS